MVVDACTRNTQETEAGRPCLKRKEVIPTKVTLPLAGFLVFPCPCTSGLSWPLGHFPSSTDILAVFAYELLSGTK